MGINLVWCGICAKYLAFGTYPTSAMGALSGFRVGWVMNGFGIEWVSLRQLLLCLVCAVHKLQWE